MFKKLVLMATTIFIISMVFISFSACSAGGDDEKISGNDDDTLLPSTIIFKDGTAVSGKTSTTYTNIVSGDGDGEIYYFSDEPAVASVNAATGEAVLVGIGTTEITAIKVATATHAFVMAAYTLTVEGYNIGETGPSGIGIVFYIENGGRNGLEAAPSLWNSGSGDPKLVWQNIINDVPGTLTSLWAGYANTYYYMTGTEYPAAELCRTYNGGGMNDWFLPSLEELAAIWNNLVDDGSGNNSGTGGFSDFGYYSSSQLDVTHAHFIYFADGYQGIHQKDFPLCVRPVRAF